MNPRSQFGDGFAQMLDRCRGRQSVACRAHINLGVRSVVIMGDGNAVSFDALVDRVRGHRPARRLRSCPDHRTRFLASHNTSSRRFNAALVLALACREIAVKHEIDPIASADYSRPRSM